MRPLVERADRLQRLAAFDAAARLGSFTAAATELGSTQPAVTRQIRALERSLGLVLFERSANRSRLTPSGRELADAVDAAFTSIEHALSALGEQNATFVLASPPGFAQLVLVPILDQLHSTLDTEHGNDLRLWLYDRDSELEHGEADAMIRIGRGEWSGLDSVALFDEAVVPVATHAFAEEHGLDAHSNPADVLAAPLLHMDAADRPWMSWDDWLDRFDLSLTRSRRGLVSNAYPTIVQQALAGRGVALGWRGVIDRHLEDGLLVVVGPEVTSDRSYRLAWPMGRRTPKVDAVIRWMSPDR
ncbi:LysR substrate-binding domain-containing protein [Ilumatobacter sp.]|uniref:LysR substrate-binding domain-containing protein n=1 Tax=Ilumatobacter sp. TaxID=1967498 RepID=UPI003C53062A